MKILHIFGRMDRGGAELRTLDIMQRLDTNEFQVHFCVLSGLPGELDVEIKHLGGKVHYLPLRKIYFPMHFRNLLQSYHFDVVHSHVHYPSGFFLWLAATAKVSNRITHFRSSQDGKGNSWARQIKNTILHKMINRYSTHILAVSKSAMIGAWRSQWEQDQRCKVIYNGIDTEKFLNLDCRGDVRQSFGISDYAPLFIHVGNFTPPKNHIRLLLIFQAIVDDCPDAYLLLAGSGDNLIEDIVRKQVNEANLDHRVIFAGKQTDIPSLLSAADVFIFPSTFEGLPGAVLEACAAGVPVLASDLPVIEEISPQLPLLQSISLNASDSDWADAAIQLLRMSAQKENKINAQRAFARSQFTLDAAVEAHKYVWLKKQHV